MNIVIKIADSPLEIAQCFPVLVQLRSDLVQAQFVERIDELRQGGYCLAHLKQEEVVCAVAGFRIGDMLFRGRHLYVDDLVTDARVRSRGYGAMLLDWLVEHARAQGCRQVDLDSGVQRRDAHRFYLRAKMQITDYHFSRPI
jgi:GNAT superfamily N-acetyltransferase